MPLNKFLASRIPLAIRYALRGVSADIRPTLAYALNPYSQRAILQDLQRCRSTPDYVDFTHRWLGRGSVQQVPEIEAALDYVAAESPRRVCEIGTDYGGTTLVLSHVLRTVELQVGVDLYVKNRWLLQALHRRDQQLCLINGSSHAQHTLERVARLLNGGQLDVLFIDGDHSYAGVAGDFLLYRHLVREGGFILFHDIVPDYATSHGTRSSAYSGGVPILWAELKDIYPSREFIHDPSQDGMGIGALRYSSSARLPEHLLAGKVTTSNLKGGLPI